MLFAVILATAGKAGDIDFKFEIPTIPYPPDISDVTNAPAVVGAATFKVSATILGQMQKTGKCDIVPKENCSATDWYQIDDPSITPNPPVIKAAKVFYYYEGDTSDGGSVSMTYNSTLGKWEGLVPIKAGMVQGATINYYIAAVDGRGNLASETPSTGEEPCPDIGSWDDTLATPLIDTCSYAEGYSECNKNKNTPPGNCGTNYSLGDKAGDVCGEPDAAGLQHLITGASADKVDMLGISAGAGSSVVCTKIGLGGPPPGPSDPAPIEGYLMIFFNPDLPDSNPADTHIQNAYAITYAPEAVGSDPTLVKVLWSGDCVTNPDAPDPLACKLISAVGDHPKLKIGYQSGSLRFITNKSGTGEVLTSSYNIIGSTSGKSILVGITGEINLSGGTAFWISDLTAGFAFYHRNKSVTVDPPGEPVAGAITKTSCSVDGSASGVKLCPKSATKPASNKCRIDFLQTDTAAYTSEYRFYRNTSNSTTGATQQGTVAETGAASYNWTDTHTTLDGRTYYYWETGYNSQAAKETKMGNAATTNCTVEDWVPPAAPNVTGAATPSGSTGKCTVTWTVDAGDPSLSKFWLSRDGSPINFDNPLTATSGITEYTFPDTKELENGTGYEYTVTAVDLGNNSTTSSSVTCTPEDLKPPSSITSLLAGNIPGKLGVKMEWEASTETDLAGYKAYKCKRLTSSDCKVDTAFTAFNASVQTGTTFEKDSTQDPTLVSADFCFYVQACDTNDNCSMFPPGGADNPNVKCFTLSEEADLLKPAFPQGVACTTPAEGNKVELTWNKVCQHSTGDSFADTTCITFDPLEIQGYKVIFGASGSVPSAAEAQCANIAATVSTSPDPDATHKTKTCGAVTVPVVNGTEYCYDVYAVDAYNNVSVDGPGGSLAEVCCTPQDTQAPTAPTASMDSDDISCTPSWNPVTDKDTTIRYSVYRCTGSSCSSSSTWESVSADILQAAGLTYTDIVPDAQSPYTYCITAKDEASNESATYPATTQPNCKVCTPGNQAKAPTAVTAGPSGTTGANYGALVFWTKSKDDNGSDGGYKIYRCSNETCTSPTAVSGKGCTDLAASSSAVQNIGPTAPITLSGEPADTWYYGVTYSSDCTDMEATESQLTGDSEAISSSLTIDPPPAPDCTGKCIHVSNCKDWTDLTANCSSINVLDTSQKGTDEKFLASPKSGVEVFVADSTGAMVGTAATTDGTGAFAITIDNNSSAVNLDNKYKVVMKIPSAEKAGIACDSSFYDTEGSCYIVLNGEIILSDDDTKTARSFGINLPPVGGGRAEIGNPNCDTVVNITDLVLLKPGFGTAVGDTAYKTYLDFDGNGIIDVADFLILKKYFGNELSAAPTPDATLCKP
jgi:hypothetical protein